MRRLTAVRVALRHLQAAGAAACHIEDQIVAKRCGHRPNKQIVSTGEMVARLKVCRALGFSVPPLLSQVRRHAVPRTLSLLRFFPALASAGASPQPFSPFCAITPKMATAGRTDPNFVIIARSDALAVEGMDAVLRRCEVRREKRP